MENINLQELLNSVLEFIEEVIAGIKEAFAGIDFVRNFEKEEYLPN